MKLLGVDNKDAGIKTDNKRKKLEKILDERLYEFNKIGSYLGEKEKYRM